MPLERAWPVRSGTCPRPTVSSTASMRGPSSLDGMPWRRPWKARFCQHVWRRFRLRSSAGMKPMCRRALRASPMTSMPARATRPDVGVIRPVRTRNRVDLPAPFGPTTAKTWPGHTSSDRSATAVTGSVIDDLSSSFIQLGDGS